MPRILLAEDDPSIRQSLAEFLEEWCGHEVLGVADGDTARRALAGGRGFDAIVLDVRLPLCSGLDLLAELRRTSPTLPVLLFTGSGTAALREHRLERDPHVRLLFKPIDDLRVIATTLDELLVGGGPTS